MQERRKEESAFTLVELLLVVTIIGILAGAVLINFSGQANRAKETRARMDIQNLETALQTYEITYGSYPGSDEGIQALTEPPEDGGKALLTSNSIRDPWGNDYVYVYPGSRSNADYDLYSFGADSQEGTEDDIGNWDEED